MGNSPIILLLRGVFLWRGVRLTMYVDRGQEIRLIIKTILFLCTHTLVQNSASFGGVRQFE